MPDMASSVDLRPASIPADVQRTRYAFADQLEKMLANDIPWYDFPTPADYRMARQQGTHGFKKPVLNSKARIVTIKGRDATPIELRVIDPPKPSRGVWLHFHAGTSRRCQSLECDALRTTNS